MPLSEKTIQNLSSALIPEVINYIHEDERWAQLMHEIIPDALHEKLGEIDENLNFELSMCIMDHICLKEA